MARTRLPRRVTSGGSPSRAAAPSTRAGLPEGQRLPAEASALARSAFGVDFSAVRVHRTSPPGAPGLLAANRGEDIYLDPRLRPEGRSALPFLLHELAHVAQRPRPTEDTRAHPPERRWVEPSVEIEAERHAQRALQGQASPISRAGSSSGRIPASALLGREVANASAITGVQDWTTADREGNTQRWKDACLYNLEHGLNTEYRLIAERRDFYKWFYEHHAALGYTTRWALAASIVANGAWQVAYDLRGYNSWLMGDFVSYELEGFMRIGNQVIFDNVFPKLKQLHDGGPLTGAAAMRWDMEVLSQEQTLVQGLYSTMSVDAQEKMEAIAKKQGLVGVGAAATDDDLVKKGPYNNEAEVPAFPAAASLTSVDDRWTYGMTLGDTFTPGGTGFSPSANKRPAVGASYTSGSELAAVNTRPNLHKLDAIVAQFSGSVSVSEVIAILGALSPSEKLELARDRSPDGRKYSGYLAMMPRVPRANVEAALPASGPERASFLTSYNRLRPSWAP